MPCASEETILQFLANLLPEAQSCRVWEHLQQCRKCLALADDLCRSQRLAELREKKASPGGGAASVVDPASERIPLDPVEEPPPDQGELASAVDEPDSPAPSMTDSSTRLIHDRLRRLGRFEMRRRLGVGGFGVVYMAYDPILRRPVALKLPRTDVINQPDLRRQFLREGKAAAALHHPNLVPLYEAGEVEGLFYLASAYVEGPTLGSWIAERGRPVPPEEAAAVVQQLADAVEHVHRRGILHRDIKPNNVLLEPQPSGILPYTPKLTDFGLARPADGDSTRSGGGLMLGTPRYMAPEQALGKSEEIGPATDIYGLGTVLYELLTGRAPFDDESPSDTLDQILYEGPPAPRSLVPSIPQDLEAICLKCLNKQPEDRYQTAADLAEDLRRYLAGETTAARPVNWFVQISRISRRHPAAAGLVGITVLLLVSIIAGLLGDNTQLQESHEELGRAVKNLEQQHESLREKLRRAQQEKYAADMRAASLQLGQRNLPEFEQRMARHVPAADAPDVRGLEWYMLLHRARLNQVELASRRNVIGVRLFAEGARLAALDQAGRVQIYNTEARRVVQVLGPPGTKDFSLSADEQLLATLAENRLELWQVQNGEHRGTLSFPSDVVCFAFVSDRHLWVAFRDRQEIEVWDASQRSLIGTLTELADPVRRILPTNGDLVAVVATDGTVQLWDARQRKLQQSVSAEAQLAAFCVSPNGQYLAAAGADGRLQGWRAGSGEQLFRIKHSRPITSVAFTPDEQFLVAGDAAGKIAVWPVLAARPDDRPAMIWSAHQGAVQCLATGEGCRIASAGTDQRLQLCTAACEWQPNARSVQLPIAGNKPIQDLAFRGGTRSELVTVAPGQIAFWELPEMQPQQRLGPSSEEWTTLAVTADGNRLATADRDGKVIIWDLKTGGRQEIATSFGDCELAFSPDAQRLAISSKPHGVVWLYDMKGEPVTRIAVANPGMLAFSDEGKRLTIASLEELLCWDFQIERQVWSHAGTHVRPTHLACHLGQDLIATVTQRGGVMIWKISTGQVLAGFAGPERAIQSLAFSSDGRSLLTGNRFGTIKAWQVHTGEELLEVARHDRGILHLRVSPDDRYLSWLDDAHEVFLLEATSPLPRREAERDSRREKGPAPSSSRPTSSVVVDR